MTKPATGSLMIEVGLLKTALGQILKTGAAKWGQRDIAQVRLYGDVTEFRMTSIRPAPRYQLTAIFGEGDVVTEGPFDQCIAIDQLQAALNGRPSDEWLTIEYANDETTIRQGRREITKRHFVGPLPMVEHEYAFAIADLGHDRAWRKLVDAADNDYIHAVLAGIHAKEVDGYLHLMAADGFRLGYLEGPPMDLAFKGWSATYPAEMFRHVPAGARLALCNPAPLEHVGILRYEIGHGIEILALADLIHGQYPDLTQIIPERDRRVVLQAQDVLEAAAYAKKYGKDGCLTKITSEGLVVPSQSGQATWNHYDLDLGGEEYAFNGEYLAWAAKGNDQLCLELGGAQDSACVHDGALTLVIMPMVTGGY